MLEALVGQHLMIGIAGDKLTPQSLRTFQETHAAGLIVFRPNFKSAAAFKKLLTDLEEKLQRKLLVAVDHEGGRVIHLAEGITVFPDNWALGNTKKIEFAKKQGEIEARELRRLGMDVNLAPTLDVLTKNFSPNIGIRSYGHDPELVSQLGIARIRAMQASGLSACAKHFPGLGAATLDPHLDLPVLGADWKEMERIHLKPFIAAIENGVDCMMSSHFVIDAFGRRGTPLRVPWNRAGTEARPYNEPVTFSKKIIQDFLRDRLKFKGLIFSDDLEMGALRGLCSIGESAVRAVEAGHDMVLLCHDPKAQREAHRALFQAYKTGRLALKNLEQSGERIQSLIRKRVQRFEKRIVKPEPNGEKVAGQIAKKGISVTTSKRNVILRPKAEESKILRFAQDDNGRVIFPRLSSLASKFFIEKEMLNEKKFLQKHFKRQKIHIVSLDPSEEEIRKLKKSVKDQGPLTFFCYDAHLFKGNKRILEWIQTQKNSQAVLMRDPYDESFIKKNMPYIQIYGFRKAQIEAAVKIIKMSHQDTSHQTPVKSRSRISLVTSD